MKQIGFTCHTFRKSRRAHPARGGGTGNDIHKKQTWVDQMQREDFLEEEEELS